MKGNRSNIERSSRRRKRLAPILGPAALDRRVIFNGCRRYPCLLELVRPVAAPLRRVVRAESQFRTTVSGERVQPCYSMDKAAVAYRTFVLDGALAKGAHTDELLPPVANTLRLHMPPF